MEKKENAESTNREVKVENENLKKLKEDHFHHLAISTNMKHFNSIFSDVKFVCFGGSAQRMERLAKRLQIELNLEMPPGFALTNISSGTDRYVLFKAGPVLCVNHGIGVSSAFVVIHEVIKALYYSRAMDVCFFRVGTSGGLGLEPGMVVLTKKAFDSCLRPYLEIPILGEMVKKDSELDTELNTELMSCSYPEDKFKVVIGNTMCSWDFYEGQGRLDGASCSYDESRKIEFLNKAKNQGILNIEMESLCFGALCKQSNIRAAVVCVVYVNRLEGDQIVESQETLAEWQDRPMTLVIRYMKKRLPASK